jgi:hypothetical protein
MKTKIFEALGQASMCWSEIPNGVFDSSKVLEVGNELLKSVYTTEGVQEIINDLDGSEIELINDKWHSFKELYEFRKMYNAALFNEWANHTWVRKIQGDTVTGIKFSVHKSWKHYDGELCFGGGWFIVSAMLPTGLISNHYEAKDWDMFKIPEVEKALFEYDGHTGQDVLNRLKQL